MKRFLSLSVGAFFIVTGAGCAKPIQPQYLGYENFRIEKIGIYNNVIGANLKFYNPNRYALKLKKADLDISFNDHYVGHTVVDSQLTLKGRDTSFVPIRLQASAKDVLVNAARLLISPSVRVKIEGKATVGRGSFFKTFPVNYEGMQRIQLLEKILGGKDNR